MATRLIRTEADRARAIQALCDASLHDGPLLLEIDRPRSASQNALMWLWHRVLAEYTGHTVAEIHHYVKWRFLPPQTASEATQAQEPTTTTLGRQAMAAFLDAYQAWAQIDLGITLPSSFHDASPEAASLHVRAA